MTGTYIWCILLPPFLWDIAIVGDGQCVNSVCNECLFGDHTGCWVFSPKDQVLIFPLFYSFFPSCPMHSFSILFLYRVMKSMSARAWPSCWPRCSLNHTLTWRWKTNLSGTVFLAGQSGSTFMFWFMQHRRVVKGFAPATSGGSVSWGSAVELNLSDTLNCFLGMWEMKHLYFDSCKMCCKE